MFTIEVEKKEKNEEFGFEDLRMFHQECYGGKIEIRSADGRHTDEGYKKLVCVRCALKIKDMSPDISVEIVKTAIDGQERALNLQEVKGRVVQK